MTSRGVATTIVALAAVTAAGAAAAEGVTQTGGRLLATGGVTGIEGAAGGGLTPWAVIGGYGTRDQIGANAFYTRVQSSAYHLDAYGVMVGIFDRVELSAARQRFNTEAVGAALGLGRDFTFTQDVFGVKVRLLGDAVLDQDTWIPQVSAGVQYKRNHERDIVQAVGARDHQGVDVYASATKLILDYNLLVNATARLTKANQLGILGFGGRDDRYRLQGEASVGYLLSRTLLVGAEYRMKPDNLAVAKEDDWYDVFVAWVPSKHVSVTAAYARLGNIVTEDDQNAAYLSVQIGF